MKTGNESDKYTWRITYYEIGGVDIDWQNIIFEEWDK